LKDLTRVIKNYQINEVVIAIPSAPGRAIRDITETCRRYKIPFRTMPGIYELIGGDVNVTRLREVEIADLLRRPPTPIDEGSVGEILRKKVVLVTGAGGSIGSELCRQIARWAPARLVLLGHGENSIFETCQALQKSFPGVSLVTAIADVRDQERIDQVFRRNKPEVVFHAAAHKHVPLMETNIEECVLNNVFGSKVIMDACEKHSVKRFVFISTDKAVRPISIMGATKRIAEMLVLNAATRTKLPYSVVRFGNVLGSRGSVVPLFKQQIAQGGPVTVTHPEMTRYFMTIPEAVYLVLQSAGMGKGGETFVLDMGEQIRIVDLAKDLIRLSGYEPDKDIEIIFSGVRDGEKLSEDLWNDGRNLHPTEHPAISCEESEPALQPDQLQSVVDSLVDLSLAGKAHEIIDLINQEIPEAQVKFQGERKL
jgi:FlaA1/EpsC-like NDP-sugar epimerase